MTDCFNSYMDAPEMDYWRRLCIEEGELITYAKGEEFCRVDEVARYVGFVKSGTLKYLIYGEDGSEHVVGLEFAASSLRIIRSRCAESNRVYQSLPIQSARFIVIPSRLWWNACTVILRLKG